MKQGDIIFIQGKSFISKIIRHFDRNKDGSKGLFSHVAIAVSEKQIIEAEYSSKVTVVNLNSYIEKGKIALHETLDIKLTKEERQIMYEQAMKFIGRRYDYIQIASYITNKLFGWNLVNNKERFICSELVVASLYRAGLIDGSDYGRMADMTPNQLYEHLKSWER